MNQVISVTKNYQIQVDDDNHDLCGQCCPQLGIVFLESRNSCGLFDVKLKYKLVNDQCRILRCDACKEAEALKYKAQSYHHG